MIHFLPVLVVPSCYTPDSSVLNPTIPSDSATSMSTQVIPTELSTMNPDHHHSTPAAATPMPQLTSPPSARNLIVALHYSPDYLPPSPSTIPVVSLSSSLSPLLINMPPIHPLSPVTSSLPPSKSNPLVKSGISGSTEQIGWWIAWALEVRVVGTLECATSQGMATEGRSGAY